MNTLTKARKSPCMSLKAETAADLMTPNPVSIREDATVAEAVRFLTAKGFSGAPVIDAGGRPVGVLSRADILVHDRDTVRSLCDSHSYYGNPFLPLKENPFDVFSAAELESALVRDVMTPVVYSVTPETPAQTVVEEMVELKVHRLFVVDRTGTLVGVVSALDVLRRLGA